MKLIEDHRPKAPVLHMGDLIYRNHAMPYARNYKYLDVWNKVPDSMKFTLGQECSLLQSALDDWLVAQDFINSINDMLAYDRFLKGCKSV